MTEEILRPGSGGSNEIMRQKRIKVLEQRAEDTNLSMDQRRKAWDEAGRIKARQERGDGT